MLAYMCTWHIAPHLAHCPNIQPYSARTGARIESKECRVHDNQGGECQPRRLNLLLLLLPRSSRAKKQPRGNRAKKQPPSPERSTHEVIEPRRQLKRCAAASCHTHTCTHTHTHIRLLLFKSRIEPNGRQHTHMGGGAATRGSDPIHNGIS